MATVQPKGEQIRRAVKWISEKRREGDRNPIALLIQKAALQFNLSPKEEEFLVSFYGHEEEGSSGEGLYFKS